MANPFDQFDAHDNAFADAEPGVIEDVAKAVPRGLAKGVTGLVGLPAELREAGGAVAERLGASKESGQQVATSALGPLGILAQFAPTTEQIRETIQSITGPWGETQTTPGKYAESVAEFVPAAMIGPESLLVKAGIALGGGVGAEKGAELAGPVGRLAGGMLGGGLSGGTLTAAKARPGFDEVYDTFKRLGLTPTAATTGVGGKTAQWLEANVLPQTIGSANRMQKVIEGNLQQFTKQQQEIASAFGAPKPKYDTGHELQETLLTGWEQRKDEAGKIMNAIQQAFSPADMFKSNNLLNAVLKPVGAASTKQVKDITDSPELTEVKTLLDSTGGMLSFADMKALKSKFGEMLSPRYDKSVNAAQISQVQRALDQDIEEAVKSLGNKDVLQDWHYAKATYKDAMDDYRTAFKKLLGTREMPIAAEKVYNILVGQAGIKAPADLKAFETVWHSLGKAKQGDLAATVLSHMGNRDPSKLGDMEGFSLSTFLTNYKNLSPDAKNMLFKTTGNATLEQAFDDLVLAAQKMSVWDKLASTSKSNVAGPLFAQSAMPVTLAVTGQWAAAMGAAALNFVGPSIAAQVLTRPAFVKALSKSMDKVNAAAIDSMKSMIAVEGQLKQQ